MDGACPSAVQGMGVVCSGASRHRSRPHGFAGAGGEPVCARHRQWRVQAVPALANPPHDAEDVAATLKSLGFKVTLKVNLGLAAMQRAVDEFALESANADVSLFYYAGHGLQFAGRNYLVPVGAELRRVDDLATRMVALDAVLAELGKGKGVHLVFLDACRNNPFARRNRSARARAGARWQASRSSSLSATQPNVAFDGEGRSPFATAFLAHRASAADVSSMMIAVRSDVFAATGGQQISRRTNRCSPGSLFRRRQRGG